VVVLYHYDMRNLAVRTCNLVATPDYSRPQSNLNHYDINKAIYKARRGSVCHVVAIGRVGRRLASWSVNQLKKNQYDRHARIVGAM
jgi:hypothetical protein